MDTKLHSLLYRILKDRLSFVLDGLSFFIQEPTIDVLQESYLVYEEAYHKAYMENNLTDEELDNFLIENDIWSPIHEKQIEEIKKELEELKVSAFENFFKSADLRKAKLKIQRATSELTELLSKKHSMDHLSCAGVAEQSRFNWIISVTSFNRDGSPINWTKHNLSSFINIYRENTIDHTDLRKIARNDPWRSMWSLAKKTGRLFDCATTELSRDKLMLCSYSSMYDSVFESPDAPSEKVVEDDDCLDGWFISQRRKYDKMKKEKESDDLIKNPKIKNSKEVFLMARNSDEAGEIHDLNNSLTRSVLNQRQQVINEKGKASDLDFSDVRTELQMQQNQMFVQKMRGK